MRLNQLVGPGTTMAKMTIDPAAAGVDTMIRPAAAAYTANADGTINADLIDATTDPAAPPTALMAAALNRALLTTAHANASFPCGPNAVPLAVAGTNPVMFDITQAKVLSPAADLSALATFITTASTIRGTGNTLRNSLAKLNKPDLDAKMNAFADVVDREIRPAAQTYGATMTRDELKTHIQNAWSAYKDLATAVLTTTQQSSSVDSLQSKNADGTYAFAAGTPSVVTDLLPTANDLRVTVDGVMSQQGDGWTLKDLK